MDARAFATPKRLRPRRRGPPAAAGGGSRDPPTNDGAVSSRIRGHARLDDLVGILHRLAALDLVDVLHPRSDLAPHRILVVEEGCVVEADEELAVAGIR